MQTRKLTIIALDPAVRIGGAILRSTVEVPCEPLGPGPRGHRVEVIDYDGTRRSLALSCRIASGRDAYSGATDEKLIADRRFHAQNVYAIAMRTVARFEYALGRRAGWAFPAHQLLIAPHAFESPTAFYSPGDRAIVFGYFPGSEGPVYTALSHDIVAHECAHAMLDGLRPEYMNPSSPDQAAFHEGFADIVALLSVFSLPGVIAALLGGRELESGALTAEMLRQQVFFGLAHQMGAELSAVRGQALRRSVTLSPGSDWKRDPVFSQPHRRGEVVVAAVMNCFLKLWLRTIRQTGAKILQSERVAEDGALIAERLLTMCIRAIDYAPPTDIAFHDFLSAALTAEREIAPSDRQRELRSLFQASFAAYGIAPKSKGTGGRWERPGSRIEYESIHLESLQRDPDEMFRFLWQNRKLLGLYEQAATEVQSVRPCTRIGADGFSLRETVASYIQRIQIDAGELHRLGIHKPESISDRQELILSGGGTLIFDDFGRLKYHVRNKVNNSQRQSARLAFLWQDGRGNGDGSSIAEIHRRRRTMA